MTRPPPVLAQPQYAYARVPGRRGPARRTSVTPQMLVSCAMEGPNPRRRPSLRVLRIIGILAILALCGAFWMGVTDALARTLG